MTFHKISQANDRHGIVPTVFAITKQGSHDRKSFARSADQLQTKGRPIRLEQSKLQQGPLRHPDVVTWSADGSPFGYFLVVSPRVHELLSMAALPAHSVHEALVQWPQTSHKEHGRGATTYLVYTFEQSGMLDAFDLAQTSLSATVRLLSERMNINTELPPGSVTSGAEAWAKANELAPDGQRGWVTPTALLCSVNDDFEPVIGFDSPHFPIQTTDVDLVFLDHSFDPWVSDELRAALVAMGATGIHFPESWDAAKLKAPTSPAREARAKAMLAYAKENAGEPTTDPSFAKHLARRAEVLSRRDRLRAKKRGSGPIEELETKLDVEFPAEYRDALKYGKLPTRGRFRFYDGEELVCLEDIDPDWSEKSAPHAVRALLVAVDDSGDFLGYILEEDSMTKLGDTLMHFHHETAAVTTSRFKLKLAEVESEEDEEVEA